MLLACSQLHNLATRSAARRLSLITAVHKGGRMVYIYTYVHICLCVHTCVHVCMCMFHDSLIIIDYDYLQGERNEYDDL